MLRTVPSGHLPDWLDKEDGATPGCPLSILKLQLQKRGLDRQGSDASTISEFCARSDAQESDDNDRDSEADSPTNRLGQQSALVDTVDSSEYFRSLLFAFHVAGSNVKVRGRKPRAPRFGFDSVDALEALAYGPHLDLAARKRCGSNASDCSVGTPSAKSVAPPLKLGSPSLRQRRVLECLQSGNRGGFGSPSARRRNWPLGFGIAAEEFPHEKERARLISNGRPKAIRGTVVLKGSFERCPLLFCNALHNAFSKLLDGPSVCEGISVSAQEHRCSENATANDEPMRFVFEIALSRERQGQDPLAILDAEVISAGAQSFLPAVVDELFDLMPPDMDLPHHLTCCLEVEHCGRF